MSNDTLELDYPAMLQGVFPQQLPTAVAAVREVIAIADRGNFNALEERSPGLRDNDWSNYLHCSIARMCHAAFALQRAGIRAGRVLDYGAYFGNFSLMLRRLGYSVDAVDSYETYGASLREITDLLEGSGTRVHDFGSVGRDLSGLSEQSFDAVLCMGVVEHIPHTPRFLLEALNRVLKPGGVLLIETPNLAHLYNRQKLARGEAIMTPLPAQYYATIPFEGHHREYTPAEVVWMVQQLGHDVVATQLYNYSVYGQTVLTGRDVANYAQMMADPALREVILVISRKGAGDAALPITDWTKTLVDAEATLRPSTSGAPHDPAQLVSTEPLLAELYVKLQVRDRMLHDLQAALNDQSRQVALRDEQLIKLQDTLNAMTRADGSALTFMRRAVRWLQRRFSAGPAP